MLGGKNDQICKKKCFVPNADKCQLGVSHDPSLLIWGVKNAKISKEFFASHAPKSHLGGSHDQSLHIWGRVRNAKICTKKVFCSKCPQKSFGGLLWPKFAKFAYLRGQGSKMPILWLSNDQNLHLLWAKNAPNFFLKLQKKKFPKTPNILFSHKCPKKSFGGLQWTFAYFFWGGANYLHMLLAIQQPVSKCISVLAFREGSSSLFS